MRKNNEFGITLIALTITIIVILILTGISVGQAKNGKGVQNRTKVEMNQYNSIIDEQLEDLNNMNIENE